MQFSKAPPTKLEEVELNGNLKTIGTDYIGGAFENCTSLTTVKFNDAIYDYSSLGIIYWNKNVFVLYRVACALNALRSVNGYAFKLVLSE